ncbi:acyl carrier protein [Rubrobacter radiotolerans]|uniref:Phosphopantetheine-binding protein n=1 Tax=Rubrobacter radiotolerans TaxID=42256 RepID=A0AB35T868_RUBRA|nr:phosphopantetheine-binding protein [Rubrobacter radiotolerans]MDX5895316.1 phosphopantetheine-binding protein [Rubrobacter radiotolerans]SMC01629.1 Phosphopantetheine attachment site [Rubrobacter radiotolerans DSM 5868]
MEQQSLLKQDIKQRFVSVYGLDVSPDEIGDDQELFGPESSFGLDSMDVLQFIATMHEEFNFDLGSLRTDTFKNVDTIAGFLQESRGG